MLGNSAFEMLCMPPGSAGGGGGGRVCSDHKTPVCKFPFIIFENGQKNKRGAGWQLLPSTAYFPSRRHVILIKQLRGSNTSGWNLGRCWPSGEMRRKWRQVPARAWRARCIPFRKGIYSHYLPCPGNTKQEHRSQGYSPPALEGTLKAKQYPDAARRGWICSYMQKPASGEESGRMEKMSIGNGWGQKKKNALHMWRPAPGDRGLRKQGLCSQAPTGSGVTVEGWYPEPHLEPGWRNGPSPPRGEGCRWGAGGGGLRVRKQGNVPPRRIN